MRIVVYMVIVAISDQSDCYVVFVRRGTCIQVVGMLFVITKWQPYCEGTSARQGILGMSFM